MPDVLNKDIVLKDLDGTQLWPLAHRDSGGYVIEETYLKNYIVKDGVRYNIDPSSLMYVSSDGSGGQVIKTITGGDVAIVESIQYGISDSATEEPSNWYTELPTEIDPGKYLWTKTIYANGAVSYSISYQGTNGESPYVRYIESTTDSIIMDRSTHSMTPPTVTFNFKMVSGQNEPSPFSGYYTIQSTQDGTTYTGSVHGTGTTTGAYTPDSADRFVKCTLYDDDVALNILDVQTVSIISDGLNGAAGVTIDHIEEYYMLTQETEPAPTPESSEWVIGGGSQGLPAMNQTDKYLWNYEKVYYSNNTTYMSDPVIIGAYGDDGRGISGITEYYLVNNSTNTPSTGSSEWSSTPGQVSETSRYLWNYEYILYTDGTHYESIPAIIGMFSKDGINGTDSYTVLLSNENHTFPADSTGHATGNSTTGNVIGYIGTTKVATYVDTTHITGTPTGLTFAVTDNGTDHTTYTVTAGTTMTSTSGTLTIPVILDHNTSEEVEFLLDFSYSLAVAGVDGDDAIVYSLQLSTSTINLDQDNHKSPTTLTLDSFKQVGTNEPVAYQGRFYVEKTTDFSSWTMFYNSPSSGEVKTDESTATINLNPLESTCAALRCRLYKSQTTFPPTSADVPYDSQTILFVHEGRDAYTIRFREDNVSFAGVADGNSGHATGTSKTIYLDAFRGATRVRSAIHNSGDKLITGIPTGMTVTVTNPSNSVTNPPSVTISASSSMTSQAGTLSVPVEVDDIIWRVPISYTLVWSGVSPTSYSVVPSYNYILIDKYDQVLPSNQVIFGAYATVGNNKVAYSCKFKIYTMSEETSSTPTWTMVYEGSSNETSHTYTITNKNITGIKCEIYNGTTKLDEESIPVIIQAKDGQDGAPGADGVGISDVTEWYKATDSTSTPQDYGSPGWTANTIPSDFDEDKPYLWNYEEISYTDGDSTTTPKAIVGVWGKDGKGISSIEEYYLVSNNTELTSEDEWTKVPPGTMPQVDSTHKYLWNYEKITYTDESYTETTPAIIGNFAKDGNNGAAGYSNATIYLYQRGSASSAPSVPQGDCIYYFSSDTLSGDIGDWSRSFPDQNSEGQPVWLTVARAVSNSSSDTIGSDEWQTPILLVENGTDGSNAYNNATVTLYQRGSSAPSLPGTLTYHFNDGSITGTLNGWTDYVPTGTAPVWIITATAVSQSDTDDITASEWNGTGRAIKLMQNLTVASTQYAKSDQGTNPSLVTGWGSSIPSYDATKPYIWTKVTYSDGSVSYSSARQGANGASVTISSKSINYAKSNQGTNPASVTGWDTPIPPTNPGDYLWTKTVVNYTDGTNTWSTTSYSVSYIGTDGKDGSSVYIESTSKDSEGKTIVVIAETVPGSSEIVEHTLEIQDGQDGAEGQPGEDGYIHIAWANSADGTVDFSTSNDPDSSEYKGPYTYMGVYTDHTLEDSQEARDYSWSLIKGNDGLNQATITLYRRSSSNLNNSNRPSVAVTYVFATGDLKVNGSTTTGPISTSWYKNIPSGTDPVWVTTAPAISAESEVTITATNGWSTPVKMVQNGTNGYNQATIYLYQRTSSPTDINTTSYYKFSTGVLSKNSSASTALTDLDGWTRNIPAQNSAGDPLYIRAVSVKDQADIVTIAKTDWSGAVILAENGQDGQDGSDGEVYTLIVSDNVIVRDVNSSDTLTPEYITLSATKQVGGNTPTSYTTGTYVVSEYYNNTWNIINVNNGKYYINSLSSSVKAELKTSSTGPVVDSQTIPVIDNGENGADGQPAYNAWLTNENHTFSADNSGNPIATGDVNKVTTTAIVYKGTTQQSITSITYTAPTGITISPASGTNTTGVLTITANSGVARTGKITFTVTADGKTFPLDFSYSLAVAGTPSTVYELTVNPVSISRDINDGNTTHTLNPSSIALNAYSITGSTKSAYSGRFKVEKSTNNSSWTSVSTSTGNESSKSVDVSSIGNDIKYLRVSLYKAGGTTTLLDQQVIPVIDLGRNGTDAAPVYTVWLSNENHTFPADKNGNPITTNNVNKTTSTVYVFKDGVAAAPSSITGTGSSSNLNIQSGTIQSQGTTLTITASSGVALSGSRNIGVVIDSKTFTLSFSWSLAVAGNNGINTATVHLYQNNQSTTAPSKPTSTDGTVYYKFSDNTLYTNSRCTTRLTSLGGWTPTPSYNSDYNTWEIIATAASNTSSDSIEYTEWRDPILISGKNGINQATLYIYKRSSSTPNTPSGGSYNFTTGTLTPPTGWYTAPQDANSSNDPCYVSSVHIIGTGNSVNSISGWSAPVIYIPEDSKVISYEPLWYLKDSLLDISLKGNTSQSGTPSPDLPVFINTVRNKNEINVINKNLYNSSFRTSSNNIYAVNCTVTESDGVFTLTATGEDMYIWQVASTGNSYNVNNHGQLFDFTDNTYTISVSNTTITANYLTFFDENLISLGYSTFGGVGYTKTFSKSDSGIPANAKYFTLRFGYNHAVTGQIYSFTVQLEANNTSTSYEPYKEINYPIVLGGRNIARPWWNPETKQGITMKYNPEEQTYTFNGTCDLNNTTFVYCNRSFDVVKNVTTRRAYWVSGSVTNFCSLRAFNTDYTKSISFGLTTLSESNRVICMKHTGDTFTASNCSIRFNNGSVANNFTIKIMFANDDDLTYEPYISEKVNNLNQQDNVSNGFLPQSGTYPTENTSYPNAQYFIVDLAVGETLVIKGSTNSNGRVRLIQNGSVLGSVTATNTYVRTNADFGSHFSEGYITALQNVQIGIMFLVGWQGSGGSDLVVYKQTYNGTNPIELCKIGTVKDYIYQSGNKWYVHKEIGKVVLNGSEDIGREQISNSYYKFYINNIPNVDYGDTNYIPKIMSDKLVAVSRTTMYVNTQGITSANNNLQIYTDDTKEMTMSGFRTWLGKNNITVYYVREYPFEIEITDTNLIYQLENLATATSYDGGTNIRQTNTGLPFEITYDTSATIAPDAPDTEVNTSSTLPGVWSLTPPTYIPGYRYYTTTQTKFSGNPYILWSNVIARQTSTDGISAGITNQSQVFKVNQDGNFSTNTVSDDILLWGLVGSSEYSPTNVSVVYDGVNLLNESSVSLIYATLSNNVVNIHFNAGFPENNTSVSEGEVFGGTIYISFTVGTKLFNFPYTFTLVYEGNSVVSRTWLHYLQLQSAQTPDIPTSNTISTNNTPNVWCRDYAAYPDPIYHYKEDDPSTSEVDESKEIDYIDWYIYWLSEEVVYKDGTTEYSEPILDTRVNSLQREYVTNSTEIQKNKNSISTVATSNTFILNTLNGVDGEPGLTSKVGTLVNDVGTLKTSAKEIAAILKKEVKDASTGETLTTIEGAVVIDMTPTGDYDPSHPENYYGEYETVVTIGNSTSDVRGEFSNTGLEFIHHDALDGDTKIAWLDSTEGLGASELSIGTPDAGSTSNIKKRWRIYTREEGSHLTFTRHS